MATIRAILAFIPTGLGAERVLSFRLGLRTIVAHGIADGGCSDLFRRSFCGCHKSQGLCLLHNVLQRRMVPSRSTGRAFAQAVRDSLH